MGMPSLSLYPLLVIPHVHEPYLSRPKYDVMAPECSANTRGLKDDQACTQPSTILTVHITLDLKSKLL